MVVEMKIACRIGFHPWEDQEVGMLCPIEYQVCPDCGLERQRDVLSPHLGWKYKSREKSHD
jgi:hypothetical protein